MNKRITMKDIATELNLSINAVSLALNNRAGVSEDTRRLVLNTAERMGYLDQSSKFIETFSSKNICVMLKNRYFKDMHFYGRILLGLEEAARKNGYDVLINSFEEDRKIPNCIENRKVSGIIVVGKIDDAFLIRLKEYGVPVLLVDHTSLVESTDSILTDNKLGSFKATKYLLEKGFRKIGFFGSLEYTFSIRERYWGYVEALRFVGQVDNYNDIMTLVNRYSILDNIERPIINNDVNIIKNRLEQLVELPEAFVCSNDRAAIALCKTLGEMGLKVPRDISVFGFDDISLGTMVTPSLTTVHVSKEYMGTIAMEKMINRIEHPRVKVEKTMLDVKIVERDSVGGPRE